MFSIRGSMVQADSDSDAVSEPDGPRLSRIDFIMKITFSMYSVFGSIT